MDHEVPLVIYGRGALCLGFATVRMPDIQELRDAFQRALPVVRRLLAANA